MGFTEVLDSVVTGALAFFALSICALLAVASTLLPQINRTLNAYEQLARTLNAELAPTLLEVRKVAATTTELQRSASDTATLVTSRVEDLTGTLNKATSAAKTNTGVVSAGLLAGVKNYLGHSHGR